MQILVQIVHVIASLFLVMVVLLQSGRGGGMGAALGGASGQIFGGRGAGNFLSRVTSGIAVVFFLTSLTLSMMSSRQQSVVRGHLPATAAEPADAEPDDAAQDDGADAADGHNAGATQEAAPAAGGVDAAPAAGGADAGPTAGGGTAPPAAGGAAKAAPTPGGGAKSVPASGGAAKRAPATGGAARSKP